MQIHTLCNRLRNSAVAKGCRLKLITFIVVAVFCIPVFGSSSFAVAAEEDHAPVFVVYAAGLIEEEEVADSASEPSAAAPDFGPALDGLIFSFAERSLWREIGRNTMVALNALADMDFPQMALESWACIALPEETPECRPIMVRGPGSVIGSIPDFAGESDNDEVSAIMIDVSINSLPLRKVDHILEARASVKFLARTDGEFRRLNSIDVFYEMDPRNELDRSPFYIRPDRVREREMRQRAPAREYWFGGDAGPTKALVSGFVEFVPEAVELAYQTADGSAHAPNLEEWYESLPEASSVFNRRDVECPLLLCTERIVELNHSPGRHVFARMWGGQLALLNVPCEWTSCTVEGETESAVQE